MAALVEPIIFSKTALVISYDVDGRIIEVPLTHLTEAIQLNANDFYVKDDSANDGIFNVRDTLQTFDGELFDLLNKYVTVVKLGDIAIAKSDTDIDKSFRYYQSAIRIVQSEEVDLKVTGTIAIEIPIGFSFYADEIGLIITDAGGVTIQPVIRIGFDGDTQGYKTDALTTGLLATNDRAKYTPLVDSGKGVALSAEIVTGATAIRLKGRFYFKGFYVQNQ